MDSDNDSNESSDTESKPKIEDILLLNEVYSSDQKQKKHYYGKKSYKNVKTLAKVRITHEDLENIIIDNLNGPYFSGYVRYFKSHYKDCLDNSLKNSQKSIKTRIEANELFTKTGHSAEIHKEIWELYCKSIAFAPVGSKELVLAYECRSNLLLHLKHYTNCVRDIDRALRLTKFDLLIVKLLSRKMTCFVALNKNTVEKMELLETLNNHLKQVDAAFKDEKFSKMVEQAQIDSQTEPNITANATTSSQSSTTFNYYERDVDVVYGKQARIIAKRDFAPGEVVAMKKPLVRSFNPSKFYAYCSHCLSFMWAGIPCDECSLCMYCSEECKTEAWHQYHILECKLLPHINIESIHFNTMHLGTRVFLKAIREFGSITKLCDELNKTEDMTGESKSEMNFLKSDFLQFIVLSNNHINNTAYNMNAVSKLAMKACFLIACMIQTGEVFENTKLKSLRGKELAKEPDIVVSAYLLLKILITTIGNLKAASQVYTIASKCNKYATNTECNKNRHCIRGTYYDTFNAMFEKSCNPNVARCWTNNGKIIYYCVQPIKKFEKITICNYTEFFKLNKAGRDKYCYFSIYCMCTACLKNWPLMEDLFEKFKQRRLKIESRETEIVDKYLKRNRSNGRFVEERNCEFNEEEYQELLRDVNDVIKVCGQPSFASSLMINYLCIVFEKRYGTISLVSQVPAKC